MLRQLFPRILVTLALVAALLHSIHNAQDEPPDSYVQYVTMVTNGYCLAPARLRTALRELINNAAAPNKIRVECAADAI